MHVISILLIIVLISPNYGQEQIVNPSQAYYQKAEDEYARLDLQSAIQTLEAGLRLDSTGNFGSGQLGYAYMRLGDCHFMLGHLDDALTLTNKSLQLDPINPEARWVKARIFESLGRPKQAIQELQVIIDQSQGGGELIYTFRGTLYESLGKKRLAKKDYIKVKGLTLLSNDTLLYEMAETRIRNLRHSKKIKKNKPVRIIHHRYPNQ